MFAHFTCTLALLALLGAATASPLDSETDLAQRQTTNPCHNTGICSGPTGTVSCTRNLNPKTPWCICNCAASSSCFPLILDGWCFSSGGFWYTTLFMGITPTPNTTAIMLTMTTPKMTQKFILVQFLRGGHNTRV
ncbi:hypothetical protein B0H10DRAFT_1952645 [Mycena sp. CBHHK59/15]|nr:hypothetical protein B0H10DRAFT_1952645 [Mycena sp. CBHHK59/15]